MNVESNDGRLRSASDDEAIKATKPISRWFGWIVGIVILLGVGLRLAYGDQRTYNPDEQIAVAVVKNLGFPGQWDTNWAKTDVTESFRYDQYNFSSYHYLLYFWKKLGSWFGLEWIGHLWGLRMLNGLLGGVFLAAVAFAARRFAGELAGIAAAAAGAVAPLLIQDAHYVRCESMLTAGVAVVLWLGGRQEDKNGWLRFSGGLLIGLMVAAKATMGLAVLLLVPWVLPGTGFKITDRKLLVRSTCVVVVGLAVGILLGMPGAVFHPRLYFSGLAKLSEQYQSSIPPYTAPDMAPSYLVTLAYLKGTMGWAFWALAGLGVWRLVTGMERLQTVLMIAMLAGAFVVFGSHPYFSERSFSPFLPVAAVFFGAGCEWLVRWVARARPALSGGGGQAGLLVLLLALTLAWPAVLSWRLVASAFSGRDTAEQLAFVDSMHRKVPGRIILVVGPLFGPKERAEMESALANKESLLVIMSDDCDAFSSRCLAVLQNRYHGQILDVRDSLFPDLPSCTLHTFISPRLWGVSIPAP